MPKFCNNCCTELSDDALICSNCGMILNGSEYVTPASADPDPVIYEPQAPQEMPRPKKKGKWWLAPIAAVLALVVAAAFLWKPLLLKFAPRTYLAMASGRTMSALGKRSEGSPAALIGTASEYMNDGTMDIRAVINDEYSGQVSIDASVAADQEAKKWAVNAGVSSMGQETNFDLYMDADFLALRSSMLADGAYYGLTYDSFEEDLRASAFGEMLTEDDIALMTEMVDTLDKSIESPVDYEALMAPYIEKISEFSEGLTMTTGSAEIELDGKQEKCDTISVAFEKDELLDLMNDLLDMLEEDDDLRDTFKGYIAAMGTGEQDVEDLWKEMVDELRDSLDEIDESTNAEGVLTYYIHGSKLAAIGCEIEFTEPGGDGEINVEMMLSFGTDAAESDIILDMTVEVDREEIEIRLVSSVEKNDSTYKEKLTINGNADGSQLKVQSTSDWNRSTGDLDFDVSTDVDGEKYEVEFSLKLQETESGIEIAIDDLYELILCFDETFDDYNDAFDCSISVAFSKGSDIKTPDYVNLDQIDSELINEVLGSFGYSEDEDWIDEDYDPSEVGVTPKIIDNAGLLTSNEESNLEYLAQSIVSFYEMDVVILTVDNTNGADVTTYADNYFDYNDYGIGDDNSGVLLCCLWMTENGQSAPAGSTLRH